jgi:PQQ-like domain
MPIPLWSHKLSSPAAGVALACETGHVLAWDVSHRIALLNRRGTLLASNTQPRSIAAAAIADDGSSLAVADDQSVAWLRADLSPRWRKTLTSRATAVALDSFGRCLAVADAGNRLHLFNKAGLPIGDPLSTPRPLYHLLFLAAEPFLIGAADFGLLVALDLRNRQWSWQDSPVIHLGDLAASGDGRVIALGCFSEGIRRYDLAGQAALSLATPEPCRYVATTFDGRRFLVATIFGTLCALDDAGAQLHEQRFEQPIAGVQLSPMGDAGVVALADGRVLGLDLTPELK